MSSNCVVPGASGLNFMNVDSSTDDGSGSVLMLACGGSPESYTLIFSGSGLYSFMQTMICTLAPKISFTPVDYTYSIGGGTISASTLPGETPDIVGGPAGLSAVTTIFNMMHFSQALRTNIMGDRLKSIVQNVNGKIVSANDPLRATEDYIRGVTEYSGSTKIVLRACISAKGTVTTDGVPGNMIIIDTGKFDVQFFGWEVTASLSWVLIPGTLIAIATNYAVLAHHAGDSKVASFDPSNTLDVVSASATGGLSGVFIGT
ncbi:hypothetical protein MVEN_00298400 [Mycena venus]|uniref:Uncharacterized protein n=1 Tax=Mycena venus TaxID=2733690 RepID=A0A8H7DEX5_9AGAR|nr:hypothetical protein MVEN_00298400 [Mycena venus]